MYEHTVLLQGAFKIVDGKTGFLLQTKNRTFSQSSVNSAAHNFTKQGPYPRAFLWQRHPLESGGLSQFSLKKLTARVADK